MRNIVEILGIPIDNVDFDDAYRIIDLFLESNTCNSIYTPNSEMLYLCDKDDAFKNILKVGDLILPDGAGVVLASKIIKNPLKTKVSGVDIVRGMLKNYNLKVFILGGKPGIVEKAQIEIEHTYNNITIVGSYHGYFKEAEDENIINQINSKKPDLLIVCLGMKKQEEWIHKYKNKLNVKIAIGAGGTLDVLAGEASMSPEIIRKLGFEWLHRLFKEPKRIKRMSVLPLFIIKILKHLLSY